LAQQRATWNVFREGEASLAEMRTKRLTRDSVDVIVQSNPGRHKSVHAKVDPLSVAERPCFLCLDNLPPEERGLAYGELVVLPNPHPILPRHLTIASREHVPQKLAEHIDVFLQLAKDCGEGMLVLYNGAQCGASAPDHFHFQASSTANVPLFDQLPDLGEKDAIEAYSGFGRQMILCQDQDTEKVGTFIDRALEHLSSPGGKEKEPLINLVAISRGGRTIVFLAARAKHRPQCYFEEGDARISISPAAIEMMGVLVAADLDSFERADEQKAFEIYEEVCLGEDELNALLEAVR
jgi:hypothetical protein